MENRGSNDNHIDEGESLFDRFAWRMQASHDRLQKTADALKEAQQARARKRFGVIEGDA